jgi:hypothetical protein
MAKKDQEISPVELLLEIRKIDTKVSYQSGKLDYLINRFENVFPHLVTKEDLDRHQRDCTKPIGPGVSIIPKRRRSKRNLAATIGGGLAALAGAIYGLVEAIHALAK